MTMGDVPPGVGAEPVKATVVDPLVLEMFSVALFAPPVVGANVTEAVVDEPAVSVAVNGASTENWPASVPVIVNGVVSVRVVLPLFVIVTGAMAALPMSVDAKASVPGDAVNAGPDPPVATMSLSCRGSSW